MRGHEQLIELRMRGKAMAVSIGTDRDQTLYLPSHWPALGTSHAFIAIQPDERLIDLDLRFLVGLRVHVDGCDADRVDEVYEAAKAAGATRVLATIFRNNNGEHQTVRMLDSEGVMLWEM